MASQEMNYYKNLSKENLIVYDKKLQLLDGTKLPNPYELSSWHQDIKKLPPIKLWDVSFYLLTKPSDFTKESAQNLKSMEAYYFFTAGHVQDIYMHKISEQSEFCFIKTEVKLGVFLYIFVMSMIFAFQY